MTSDYRPFLDEAKLLEVKNSRDIVYMNNTNPTVEYPEFGEDKNGYFYIKNNFAILYSTLEEKTILFSIFPKRLLINADTLRKEIERYKYSSIVTSVVLSEAEIRDQANLYLFLETDILPLLEGVNSNGSN